MNNEKSGFRNKIIECLFKENFKNYLDLAFYNGTHSSLEGINGKQPDIVAVTHFTEIKAIFEVKVHIREELQPSQSKGGEYEKYAKQNNIPLFYIIPSNYEYLGKIPDNAITVEWKKIWDIARQFDLTDLEDEIFEFVEDDFNSEMFSNTDIVLLHNPKIIKETFRLKDKIYELMTRFLGTKNISKKDKDDGLYFDYKLKNKTIKECYFGLELGSLFKCNSAFAIEIPLKYCKDTNGDKTNGYYVAFPIDFSDFKSSPFLTADNGDKLQKEFNKIIEVVFSEIELHLK